MTGLFSIRFARIRDIAASMANTTATSARSAPATGQDEATAEISRTIQTEIIRMRGLIEFFSRNVRVA